MNMEEEKKRLVDLLTNVTEVLNIESGKRLFATGPEQKEAMRVQLENIDGYFEDVKSRIDAVAGDNILHRPLDLQVDQFEYSQQFIEITNAKLNAIANMEPIKFDDDDQINPQQ